MWHAPGEARSVHLWSLSEDVRVERSAEDDTLLLTGPWGPKRLDRPAPSVREALRRMELGPVVLGNAVQEFEDLRRFILPALKRLSPLVVRTLGMDDLKGPLLSVVPSSPAAPLVLIHLPGDQRVGLPDHVVITVSKSGGGCVLESVDLPHRVVLHRPEAAWVTLMLAWPVTPATAATALPLPKSVTEDIIGYLYAAGMATLVDAPP
ncbi:NADH oxidase [Streptomyces althioticus]|uniref:NADH oxidase n=1 Tax=Streptomyces althioticus TaxID=83380 RepID=UPI0036F4D100